MTSSTLEEIRQLAELRKDEVIGAAEYEDMKRSLVLRYKEENSRRAHDQTTLALSQGKNAEVPPSHVPTSGATAISQNSSKDAIEAPTSQSTIRRSFGPTSQTTLHKYFGPAEIVSKLSGKVFISKNCPTMTRGLFVCPECEKRCQTKQALIAHRKTHIAKEITGI